MVRLHARITRWRWLWRYWVLDKYYEALRVVALFGACVLTMAVMLRVSWMILNPAPPPTGLIVVKADGGASLIIQIVLLIISLAMSYAMRPKSEPVKPQEGSIPQVEDGKAIVRIYGTVWKDDSTILGWKNLGTEAIKSKGGKKWKPGLLPGTTNPIESWLDDKWNVSGLGDVDDPLGGGNHYPDDGDDFNPDSP